MEYTDIFPGPTCRATPLDVQPPGANPGVISLKVQMCSASLSVATEPRDLTVGRMEIFVEKSLDVTSVADAQAGKVSDIKVVGNGDTFQLLCKASSKEQGWMKSTKAMETPSGCVVQVTTQQGNNIAEALTFVPGVKIVDDINGGRKLVSL